MSSYNFDNFIKDFSERTIRNMEIIDSTPESYEVTQVINSLFGLLIVPNERYRFENDRDNGNERVLEDTKVYKSIYAMIGSLVDEKRLYNDYNDYKDRFRFRVSGFIKHLRNSLAHSGNKKIHFTPINENKEIKSVIFYDSDNGYEFCTELTIEEIRKLGKMISEMYCEVEARRGRNVHNLRTYEKEVEERRNLLSKVCKK